MIDIREGGLGHPEVLALLRLHLGGMAASSPAESVHALGAEGLREPGIAFWSAWNRDELLGFGALKTLDRDHAEIKSMRTHPAHLRKGVAAALLDHLMRIARARGYRRLSLETGSGPAFEPAHALYRRYGFADCAAFASYPPGDPFSRFMSRAL